jgi:hypothetical protein
MLRMIRARIGNMLQRHCWAVPAGLRGFKFHFVNSIVGLGHFRRQTGTQMGLGTVS